MDYLKRFIDIVSLLPPSYNNFAITMQLSLILDRIRAAQVIEFEIQIDITV
jgi:hypothetical protein